MKDKDKKRNKNLTTRVWGYSKENVAQIFQVVKLAGFPGCTVEFLVQGSKWGKCGLVHLAKALLQVEARSFTWWAKGDIHVRNSPNAKC